MKNLFLVLLISIAALNNNNAQTPSKQETIDWLLGKFRKYMQDYTVFVQIGDDGSHSSSQHRYGYETKYDYSTDLFVITYFEYGQDIDKLEPLANNNYPKTQRKFSFSAADFKNFGTVLWSQSTYKYRNASSTDDSKLTFFPHLVINLYGSSCDVGFMIDGEKDLLDRMTKAMNNLKAILLSNKPKETY